MIVLVWAGVYVHNNLGSMLQYCIRTDDPDNVEGYFRWTGWGGRNH